MSIAVSKQVWERSRATGAARLVLLCLAEHADHRGVAWPSIRTIHRKTRVSERHVTRCLAWLVRAGEIEIIRRSGRHQGRVYRVLLVAEEDDPSPTPDPETGDPPAASPDLPSEKATPGHQGEDKASPKPTEEPANKPPGKRQIRAPADPGRSRSRPGKRKKRRRLPGAIRSPGFIDAWEAFVRHRIEIKRPLTRTAAELNLKRLAAVGEAEAIARIERSITNGWQGLFFPGDSGYYRHLRGGRSGRAGRFDEDDTIMRLKALLEEEERE